MLYNQYDSDLDTRQGINLNQVGILVLGFGLDKGYNRSGSLPKNEFLNETH